MADRLNAETPTGPGHNSAFTHEKYLDFMSAYDDAEAELMSALNACKPHRAAIKLLDKQIKEAGINPTAFKRAREDWKKPNSEREVEQQQHSQMLIWLRKQPVGTQVNMFDQPPAEYGVAELKMVDNAGHAAGLAGRNATDNPHHPPGSEPHTRWHNAWVRGQAEKVHAMPKNVGNAAITGDAPKRRGRPAGSKNRPASNDAAPEPQPQVAAAGASEPLE